MTPRTTNEMTDQTTDERADEIDPCNVSTADSAAAGQSLICSECEEAVHNVPPLKWLTAWGPRPQYSHLDGEPLCPGERHRTERVRASAAGYRPAVWPRRSLRRSGALFRLPCPPHLRRPRCCQWCEPDQAREESLREEHPTVWVLHVLAEHIPADWLGSVIVHFSSESDGVRIGLHGHPFEQVDRFAEALDLFHDRVTAFDVEGRPVTVAYFGHIDDSVHLLWYTDLPVADVNALLTPSARLIGL